MTDLLDNTKILILRVSKIGDRVRSFGLVASLGEMIETSEKHFEGDAVKRQRLGIGNRIAQVNQHGIKEPSGPNSEVECR